MQELPDGRLDNVNLRDDLMLGGLGVTVVAASNRSNDSIAPYLLNPATRQFGAELVHEFEVGGRAEGCAADDELGILYVAEEGSALWRYSAEPGGGSTRTEIDRVGGVNGLKADLEGVTIW